MEYFVSALDFTNTVDNRLVIWALTGTDSLNSASPQRLAGQRSSEYAILWRSSTGAAKARALPARHVS